MTEVHILQNEIRNYTRRCQVSFTVFPIIRVKSKLMIPPHYTYKICNLIIFTLHSFILHGVLVIDFNSNNENLPINKIIIYFPQLLLFSQIFQASLEMRTSFRLFRVLSFCIGLPVNSMVLPIKSELLCRALRALCVIPHSRYL